MKTPLWQKAENRAAAHFEAQKVRFSGQGYSKSDAYQSELVNGILVEKEGGFRIEVKSTSRNHLTASSSWFGKIAREAKDRGQLPALFFQFKDMSALQLHPT